MQRAVVEAVFTGLPKRMEDERGVWVSSICRDRVRGRVAVSGRGLVGDRVEQPYHGGPGAAICVHSLEHYTFWNAKYNMRLEPGRVGENVTLRGTAEEQIMVGDRVRLGTALVQVSGPRVPCGTLARRIGRSDWVKLTVRENRTGFYLRVLEPGELEAGDPWIVEERINDAGSIAAINRCMYLEFDAQFARAMVEMPGLEAWWREQARQRLEERGSHWTTAMRGD